MNVYEVDLSYGDGGHSRATIVVLEQYLTEAIDLAIKTWQQRYRVDQKAKDSVLPRSCKLLYENVVMP